MRARLVLSLLSPLAGRLIATNRMHRLEVAQDKPWVGILSLLGVRGGEVEVRIGLGALQPSRAR